jgi:hypothetical protein
MKVPLKRQIILESTNSQLQGIQKCKKKKTTGECMNFEWQ